jgi:hypothetical protein
MMKSPYTVPREDTQLALEVAITLVFNIYLSSQEKLEVLTVYSKLCKTED